MKSFTFSAHITSAHFVDWFLQQYLDWLMKLLLKVLIPVLVLVGSVFAAKTILENRPEPRKRPQFPSVQAVEATTLTQSSFPVKVRSQGTIQPTLSSTLVAEVTGTVTKLSEGFVVGGNFSKGDVLLQLDERDYTIALTQAEANLAQASAALQEESARGKLAKEEWESLRRGKKASSFTLRLPQLAAARANRDAARAQVERAKLDLERTRFIAPYDGQILEKSVDQGQFVSRGARLGLIYSSESVDVRLPLSNRQLTFLDIPTSGNVPQSQLPDIELTAVIAGVEQSWKGKVVRAEGVDAGTQQLNVIARVKNPLDPARPPLRVGQYVEADVAGRVLENVFVVPRAALREDREVLLVNKENQLERRDVVVAWLDDSTAAISEGLEAGAVLVTTPLSTVTSGTPVRATIDGKAPPKRKGRPGGKPDKNGASGEAAGEGNRGAATAGEGQRRQGGANANQSGGGQSGERGANSNSRVEARAGKSDEAKRDEATREQRSSAEPATDDGPGADVGVNNAGVNNADANTDQANNISKTNKGEPETASVAGTIDRSKSGEETKEYK